MGARRADDRAGRLAPGALLVILVVACCGCGAGSGGTSGPSGAYGGGVTAVTAQTRSAASQPATIPPSETQAPLGRQRKTSGCATRGALPDPACTPGGAFPNATTAEVCQPGYARRVRNVLPSTRDAVYLAYGIPVHRAGQYEVDHLVPLELGGNNTRANLWPQITPGYAEKDAVENELHLAVCAGRLSLSAAQVQIARDWRTSGVPVPGARGMPAQRPTSRSPSTDTSFCATHPCIANFANGHGSTVQCADGEYSQSGGLPGACNRHGGVR